ncbi:type VII secretion-associated serine protease mycosin [Micromonospora sp. NPDC000089]|uniref:type VII secretion-associated serine protease mycosin n=1 Tax=unclassified Micromonospora TaxID=2617518 RepID=UPI0036A1DA2A
MGPLTGDRLRANQWHLQYLRISQAHRISQGQGVTIAVVDTGVEPHPDLVRNLLPGEDAVPGGSGDGRQDADGHGTGMSGLISAHGHNGNGGALGIAPKAKICPIRFKIKENFGRVDDMSVAIRSAVRRDVDIISISAGYPDTPSLQEALSEASQADILVVASAGNVPVSSGIEYPAAYPGVLSVGGVDRNGNHAAVSVTGSKIDVVAPAVDIYSTSIDGKYRKGTGTSDATAIVAGAAALIRSKYPNLSADQVANRIKATAVDKGPPGKDDEYGYGVIDIVAALTADPDTTMSAPPATGAPAPSAATITTAVAEPANSHDDGATTRGLATLGVLVAAGAGYLVWRRRRRADDPPPRISR